MKILRNSLIISAYVLLLGIFFIGGYAFGNSKTPAPYPTTAPAPEENEQVMNRAPIEENERYEVIAENGRLCLYKITTSEKTLITGEDISIDIFPYEDAQELKNGVFFDDLAGAQAMFENFVS